MNKSITKNFGFHPNLSIFGCSKSLKRCNFPHKFILSLHKKNYQTAEDINLHFFLILFFPIHPNPLSQNHTDQVNILSLLILRRQSLSILLKFYHAMGLWSVLFLNLSGLKCFFLLIRENLQVLSLHYVIENICLQNHKAVIVLESLKKSIV